MRGFASLVGVCLYEQQQPEGGMHTGELAAAVLIATNTHMDLTGVTACWPVLTGIQPESNNESRTIEVQYSWVGWEAIH